METLCKYTYVFFCANRHSTTVDYSFIIHFYVRLFYISDAHTTLSHTNTYTHMTRFRACLPPGSHTHTHRHSQTHMQNIHIKYSFRNHFTNSLLEYTNPYTSSTGTRENINFRNKCCAPRHTHTRNYRKFQVPLTECVCTHVTYANAYFSISGKNTLLNKCESASHHPHMRM